MPSFKIISNVSDLPQLYEQLREITHSDDWVDSTKFASKDRKVGIKGNAVHSDYCGRRYRIIAKKERLFSPSELRRRRFLYVLIVACTLAGALILVCVRNLFTKKKENVRYAVLDESTRFTTESSGKIVYIEPELLYKGTKISEGCELNFARISANGKQKLVAVTGNPREKRYKTFEGSALEALLKIAQDKEPIAVSSTERHDESQIRYLLKHPANSMISEEDFLKFILEKDGNKTSRICTLNSESTQEVLCIIKEKNISINLNDKTPQGETLFTLWVGKGNAKITEILLDLDPSVIEQAQGQAKSPLVEAALHGSKEEAGLLIDAIDKRKICLSQEEIWITRACKNDCAFLDKEFSRLDLELKLKILFVAKAFDNKTIVNKLNPWRVISEGMLLDRVTFIKAIKNLSHLESGAGQYIANTVVDNLSRTRGIHKPDSEYIEQSTSILHVLQECDQSLYIQSLAHWINAEKIGIKQLGLSQDTLLEIAPFLTYLDITDGEFGRNVVVNCTFSDDFIGELLARTRILTHLIVRYSLIDSGLARLKNTEHLQELTIMFCRNFNDSLPTELPKLHALTISDCSIFNQPLPTVMPNLLTLTMQSCWSFNQPLPPELSKLQALTISDCKIFNQPLPAAMPNLLTLRAKLHIHYSTSFDSPSLGYTSILFAAFQPSNFQHFWKILPTQMKAKIAQAVTETLSKIDKMPIIVTRQLPTLLQTFSIDENNLVERFQKTQVPLALAKIGKLLTEGKTLNEIEANFFSLKKLVNYYDYLKEMTRAFPDLTVYLIQNCSEKIIPDLTRMTPFFTDSMPIERLTLLQLFRAHMQRQRLLDFSSTPGKVSIEQIMSQGSWRT